MPRYGMDHPSVGLILVLDENGAPVSGVVEVDTDAGYVVQAINCMNPCRISGKYSVIVFESVRDMDNYLKECLKDE